MRYKYLDGVRGVASIFIVFSHISQLYLPYLIYGNESLMHSQIESILLKFPFSLFYNGNSMVHIFMIIGGFVTAISCLKVEKIVFTKKILMRYVRLVVPIFITTMLVYIIMNTVGFSYNNIDSYTLNTNISVMSGKMSVITAIKYSFFDIFVYGDLFTGKILSYNHVLWTMKIEFISSVIIYTIYRVITNKSYYRIIILIVLMYILPKENKEFFCTYFIGAIIAELYYNKDKLTLIKKINNKYTRFITGFFSIILLGFPYVNKSFLYGHFNNEIIDKIFINIINSNFFGATDKASLLHLVGVTLFMVVVINSETMKKIFSQKYILKLGKLSYPIYLLHWTLLLFVVPILLNIFKNKISYIKNLSFSLIIFFLILLISSILLKKVSDNIISATKGKVELLYKKSK